MHLELDNVEGGAGEYKIEAASEGVDVVGSAAAPTLRLNAKERNSLNLPLTATAAGTANVVVRVSGPGGAYARAQLCADGAAGDPESWVAARCGRSPGAKA